MSKDFDQVDSFCPDLFAQFLQHSMNLLGGLVLSVVSTPYFLCVITPVFFVFARLQTYFRLSSRELKRLEGFTPSPIFSMFSESLLGLATIRACRAEARFITSMAIAWNKNAPQILASASEIGETTVWDLRQKRSIITIRNSARINVRASGLSWNPAAGVQLAVCYSNRPP